MRMMPTLYAGKGQPVIAKKVRAEIEHVLPPIKGLSRATRFGLDDPQTATILSNVTVEDDNVSVRAGYKKTATRGTTPVWALIPWYGSPNKLAAASNNELWDAQTGNRIKGGFTSNDWHWTSFSNLGEYDYTVMVNGSDGVWSWNGNLTDDIYGEISGTNLTSASPAVVTVAAGDIGKFTVNQIVYVSGAIGTGTSKANGYRRVTAKGATTLTLDVDTTGGTTQAAGVKLNPSTGIIKEDITVPALAPWVVPANFNIVISHMNRLFFIDKINLALYYLPLQAKSGAVKVFPLNALFRRGGTIRAAYTWTVDGGAGMDDMLVMFSSNGECVIYKGTDPETNFQLVGIYRFDAPMSKHSVTQYGGELYVLISTGLVPMSTMLKAETDQLGQADKGVTSIFLRNAIQYRGNPGWQTFLNPSSGRLFCNMPQGSGNRYAQMIRHMPKAVWSSFDGIQARCWNWLDPNVFFGDDRGNVYEMHPRYKNDDGRAIRVDIQMAWNTFGTPLGKRFQAVQTYMSSDGAPQPIIDMKADHDYSPGRNTPDLSDVPAGGKWNVSPWNTTPWATGERAITVWNGVAGRGRVGSIRMTVHIQSTTFSVSGWDVQFEKGAFI